MEKSCAAPEQVLWWLCVCVWGAVEDACLSCFLVSQKCPKAEARTYSSVAQTVRETPCQVTGVVGQAPFVRESYNEPVDRTDCRVTEFKARGI